MSFEIFLGAFNDGDIGYVPLSLIVESFGTAVVDDGQTSNECCVLLEYQDEYAITGKSNIRIDITPTVIDNAVMTEGFCVNNPPDNAEFWQSLCTILTLSSSALYWPGEGIAIGNAETARHLPDDMIETLGSPTVVANETDILNLMRNS